MRCPRCQQENEADAKFCEKCAAALARACSKCGRQLSPTARFCPQCAHPTGSAIGVIATAGFTSPQSYTPKHLAEKILTSRAALQGERKQVTVLFADLKGSMELLSDRDPEDARQLLDPVLERMMEAVHRFEGTVNQVMGDGIMGLFGAPIAHEDHAVRACYAALRMQESAAQYAEDMRRTCGVDVQIRVGLNSGEVVVRAIDSDLSVDYTAVGQTTHLAARMEQLARPGTTLITADTQHLAEGYVKVRPLGPVPVKGLVKPVEVYEVTGAGAARTRLQVAAGRGLTRFVGRNAELEVLRHTQHLANDGRGQIAAIIGEAGVGKSRLLYELTHSHRLQDWLLLETASASYGKAMSYLPVVELLKDYFKIQKQDDFRKIRDKVTGRLIALDESLTPALPALLALVDVPVEDTTWETMDPAQRRQRTLDAVKCVLLRETREQPLLLIFEDVHWIDSETQALLDALVESLGSTRLLLLVTYRPGYQHPWSSKTYYSQMRLDALPAESTDELLDALLGDDPGLVPVKQLLIKRGNPFFLEEIVRTLAETNTLAGERGRYRLAQPVQGIKVPPTVQAMLAARIDRLPTGDKRLLQVASVVGKDVPFTLLKAIAQLPEEALRSSLANLQTAEFIYETGLFPDLEYSFKHALTHEVTYASLLHERRRELHARIVEAIETLYGGRLSAEIERLAHHALQGELREKAVDYLRQAGIRAAARSAPHDARARLEQALHVLETMPESHSTLEQGFEIRLELRPVMQQLGEGRRMMERLREAEILAERLNDDRRRGRVCAIATNDHSRLGELDEALVTGARALEIAERLGDLRVRILTTSFLAQTHYYRGDYERAVELARNNLAALPTDWVYEYFGNSAPASVYDRACLIRSLAELGRFAEAAKYETEAVHIAESTQHAFTIAVAHWAVGTLHLRKGDWTKARSLIEHELAVVRSGNVEFLLHFVVASSAWVLAQLGETKEALKRLQEGNQLLDRVTARGRVGHRTWIYNSLGRACLLLGDLDEARRLADLAVESSPAQRGFAAHALHLLADVATHPDRFDAGRGEVHYLKALAIAETHGMRPLVGHCHRGLGKLYRHTGQCDQARFHLIMAKTIYHEMQMAYYLEQTEAEAQ